MNKKSSIDFNSRSFYSPSANGNYKLGLVDIHSELNVTWNKAYQDLLDADNDIIVYYKNNMVDHIFTKKDAIRVNKLLKI